MSKVTGYSRAQIALHWGILLLLVASFLSREGMAETFRAAVDGKTAESAVVAVAHRLIGITIFVLAVTRIGLLFRYGAPELPAGGNPVLDMAAKVTHVALYALIVVIPLSGFAAWMGLSRSVGEVHETLFTALLVFTGLHVIGALYHQFVLKDGLMDRMKRPV